MRWASLKEEDLARLEDEKPVCSTASPNAKDCEEEIQSARLQNSKSPSLRSEDAGKKCGAPSQDGLCLFNPSILL